MADYVNLQQTEFSDFQMQLATLHETVITAEEELRKKFLDVSSLEGGFYVESITSKLECLLSELQMGPIIQLSTVFAGTEQAIAGYLQGIIGIDSYQ